MTKVSFTDSVLCAIRGLMDSIVNERNLKIQVLLESIIILFALVLNVSKSSLIIIIIMCFLVIILEMFNRGFEKLIDLISPEYNKEFGKVKDIMAGVVLLTFMMDAIISFLILYNPLIHLIKELSKNLFFILILFSSIILISIIILTKLIKKNKEYKP